GGTASRVLGSARRHRISLGDGPKAYIRRDPGTTCAVSRSAAGGLKSGSFPQACPRGIRPTEEIDAMNAPSPTVSARASGLSYVSPAPDSPWSTYLSQIHRVLPYLGSLARWAETLRRPKRSLIVDVPIEMDDGTVRHFEGYRVQHNLSRGPGKGGVRYHPDVTLEEVMALS